MTNNEIESWLEAMDYPRYQDEHGYTVYYEEDMPRILREFVDYCQWLAQKPKDEFDELKFRSFKKAEIPYGVNKVADVSFDESTGNVVIKKKSTEDGSETKKPQ
jgi:hypothetical protein